MGCIGQSIPWKVYGAHTLATWGDNMWWFAGGLFMLQLDNSASLQLTAVYGLVLAASVILLGAAVGNWIDRTRRIVAARTFLAVQNLSVAAAATILSLYLHWLQTTTEAARGDWAVVNKWLVVVVSIGFCAVARLASSGTVILIQRDWIVVIANGDNDKLAGMNSVLRTIELTTYMVAPIVAGQMFYFVGYVGTGFFIAGWNVFSVVFEYLLLDSIYKEFPKLDKKGTDDTADEQQALDTPGHAKDKNMNDVDSSAGGKKTNFFVEAAKGWSVYWHHPVRNAGLGLALLYMTVLGFDNITYSYVIMQDISEAVLGAIVAVSAIVGVIGSAAYPPLRKCMGVETTGFVGMVLLVTMTSVSVASVFVPSSPFWDNFGPDFDMMKTEGHTSVVVLLTGITTARFGLWIVDLSVTQILQESVEESHRGVVNGVQDSLNNSLDLLKCVLVICLPKPEQFGILIFLSFASITLGWILYTFFYCSTKSKPPPSEDVEAKFSPIYKPVNKEDTNQCTTENVVNA